MAHVPDGTEGKHRAIARGALGGQEDHGAARAVASEIDPRRIDVGALSQEVGRREDVVDLAEKAAAVWSLSCGAVCHRPWSMPKPNPPTIQTMAGPRAPGRTGVT